MTSVRPACYRTDRRRRIRLESQRDLCRKPRRGFGRPLLAAAKGSGATLRELGLDQRDLAAAAQATESYISQLLAGKKTPPAPGRTGIYEKIGKFLKLPKGELSRLVERQRREDLKKRVADPPQPLFKAFRELILRKCERRKQVELGEIFNKEPFGVLERLVTQKLLDVAQRVASEELGSKKWLQLVARTTGQKYQQMRVMMIEFLDTDVFHVTAENCVSFLDPLIESWDVDLETLGIDVILNRDLVREYRKRFDFIQSRATSNVENTDLVGAEGARSRFRLLSGSKPQGRRFS